MKKTSKTSDKRSKKSGEISEEKLDKVTGGQVNLALTANTLQTTRTYDANINVPTVPTVPKPILKLP